MDDSAYASQAEAANGGLAHHDSLLNHSFDDFLCSPALSSVSHAGFQADPSGHLFPLQDDFDTGRPDLFSNAPILSPSSDATQEYYQSWNVQAFEKVFDTTAYTQMKHETQYAPSTFDDSKGSELIHAQLDGSFSTLDYVPTTNSKAAVPVSPMSSTTPQQQPPTEASVNMNGYQPSSPSNKSVSSFRDDDLDEESLSVALSGTGHDEIEGKFARTDPLYSATPGKDDLYHCPKEGEPGCNHRPTKLKCNYDKYVDSHLRPYKCKSMECHGIQFSSTACLLRHEREAHGMHGHGSKPHLCSFSDCDRSLLGNGFPRRYNLFDHMRRVHGYAPSGSASDDVSPTMAAVMTGRRSGNRKRKSTGGSEEVSEKRQKNIAIKTEAIISPVANQKDLRTELAAEYQKKWEESYMQAQQYLQSVQSANMQSLDLLDQELSTLRNLASKLQDLNG